LVYAEGGRYQTVLERTRLSLLSSAECQRRLRSSASLGSWFELHPSQVCAVATAEQDTCVGDGGGPLVCPVLKDDKYTLQQVRYGTFNRKYSRFR
jgi:hypothetical protein